MICTFFGHKDTPIYEIRSALKAVISELIDKTGVLTFYVGNNGNFDFAVQSILKELASEKENIKYSIVLSFIGEHALSGDQDVTVFPEGLEKTPPRFAISKRNEWLIQNSDLVIAYTKYSFSNSCKWVEKAKKRGLTVINLAMQQP
ncbi:MAG: hypothetical protein IJA78_03590 [Clostridia bacterium]|nr:hypothetical protein [Clostridia bacterium]